MSHLTAIDDKLVAEVTEWRRHLHANPETAFDEKAVAQPAAPSGVDTNFMNS